jgi:hypothetical protein
MSKAGKKPFSIGVNRIDHGFPHDPAAARSDVKAKKNPLLLLGREPPLLGKDSDIWHKPRWELGDLAEARPFAFLRESIWYGACQYRGPRGPRDTDPLQHAAFSIVGSS